MNGLPEVDIGGEQEIECHGERLTTAAGIRLPEEGRSWSEIHSDLIALTHHDYNWRAGRLPLYVYHDDEQLLSVARGAYASRACARTYTNMDSAPKAPRSCSTAPPNFKPTRNSGSKTGRADPTPPKHSSAAAPAAPSHPPEPFITTWDVQAIAAWHGKPWK